MFICEICGLQYHGSRSLYRHYKMKHGYAMSTKQLHQCNTCGANFNRKKDISKHVKNHLAELFVCDICYKSYNYKTSLILHKRKDHNGQNRQKRVCCPLQCDYVTWKHSNFRNHVMIEHKIELNIQSHVLKNMDEFRKWKENLETSEQSKYVLNHSGKELCNGSIKCLYRCHRDGIPRLMAGGRLRSVKSQGSNKIGKSCPSFMDVTTTAECVSVLYSTVHLHPKSIHHLQLSNTEKCTIAEKLATGEEISKILEEVKNEANGKVKGRIHFLKRRDIHNIIRDFNLNGGSICHENDIEPNIEIEEINADDLLRLDGLRQNNKSKIEMMLGLYDKSIYPVNVDRRLECHLDKILELLLNVPPVEQDKITNILEK